MLMTLHRISILTFLIMVLIISKLGVNNKKNLEENSLVNREINADKFLSEEFLSAKGEWKLIEFMGTGIQSHISPYVEGYDSTDIEIENHKSIYLNSILTINEEFVTNFYPPEFGYFFEDTEDLFFGYKVPLTLKAPILYINVEHKNFKNLINFIQDGDGVSYIDIDGYFYKLKKVS